MLRFALFFTVLLCPLAAEWLSMLNPITFSAETIVNVLNHGGYAIISAGRNPAVREEFYLPHRIIAQRTARLADDVKSRYLYSSILGAYDGARERSFFLILQNESPRDELADLVHLATKYNQESIIYTKRATPPVQQLIYTTGEYGGRFVEGTGYERLSSNVTDNYSCIRLCSNATFQFTLNFNFHRVFVNDTPLHTHQLLAHHQCNRQANRRRCRQ